MHVCRLIAALVIVMALLSSAASADELIGAVYVQTQPAGAAVHVNGDLKGVSPCGVADLAVGEITVDVRLQGYADATAKATIQGGKTARVNLKLVKAEDVGAIAVLVDPPGAAIQLDRVQVGTTPTVLRNVKAGTHRVVIAAEGHRPHVATVTVTAGGTVEIAANLPKSGAATTGILPGDVGSLGVIDPADVPALSAMPEERLLASVHRLMEQRRYEDALKELERLGTDEDARPYARRIARERTYTGRFRDILAAGEAELRRRVGADIQLEIGAGIGLRGKLVDVADGKFTLERNERKTSFDVAALSTGQVVELAQHGLPATEPVNAANFALLCATEKDFKSAYEWLRKAAAAGYDITVARTHVDSLNMWKLASEKATAATASRPPAQGEKVEVAIGPPVLVLQDLFHGAGVPAAVRKELTERNFQFKHLRQALTDADLAEPALLIIRDPGPGREVPPYDAAELQRIVNFLMKGGGLVFFASARPAAAEDGGISAYGPPSPFVPLLKHLRIVPRSDYLALNEVPEGQPQDAVLAAPRKANPLVAGVRMVRFPRNCCSLIVAKPAAALLQGAPWVSSRPAEEQSPTLAAANSIGKGRVVVFAQLPQTGESPWGADRKVADQGARMLLNVLQWASEPFANDQDAD